RRGPRMILRVPPSRGPPASRCDAHEIASAGPPIGRPIRALRPLGGLDAAPAGRPGGRFFLRRTAPDSSLHNFPPKPAPDLMRGGHRFGTENATNALDLERILARPHRKVIQSKWNAL